MECYERVAALLEDAIVEVNQTVAPGPEIENSPDAVLLGDAAALDSVSFITLAVAVEERVERIFNETISLIDLIGSGHESQWTVADLSRAVAARVGRHEGAS